VSDISAGVLDSLVTFPSTAGEVSVSRSDTGQVSDTAQTSATSAGQVPDAVPRQGSDTLSQSLNVPAIAVDRAMRQLTEAGIVRVEHRRSGEQFLSNRYHVRTTAPAHPATAAGGGRVIAATPEPPEGGRISAATRGRTSTARVAADVRPNPEILTDNPPPLPPHASAGLQLLRLWSRPTTRSWLRAALPTSTPWLIDAWRPVGLSASHSPARVAEAGPWWDAAPVGTDEGMDAHELTALEARLAETGGLRPALQAQARAELTAEGMPVIRSTVARRACAILDLRDAR